MGKLTILGLVWLLVFSMALILIDSQLDVNEPDQTPDGSQNHEPPQNNNGSPATGLVAIQIDGYLVDDFWERGFNDLPVLSVVANYVVENIGNVSANTVNIEISLDSMHHSSETVGNLLPNTKFRDSILFSVEYDQSKTVLVKASCGNATDSWNYTVNAELPRQPSWIMSKLFITPDEAHVESTYGEIMSEGTIIPFHWMTIRDWVGANIKYDDDSSVHGIDEYWQLGKETLERGTGDCEDFAILLCSLLRADGWGSDNVYVVIGRNEAGDYHAWVKINIPLVGWYNIEPTKRGWYTGPGDIFALSGYTPVYNFNDRYFIVL